MENQETQMNTASAIPAVPLHRLVRWFIRTFGLPGSWNWACRQLDKGKIIRPRKATGVIEYRIDEEGQRRLQCRFGHEWENAFFFLSHQEDTDWEISPNNEMRDHEANPGRKERL